MKEEIDRKGDFGLYAHGNGIMTIECLGCSHQIAGGTKSVVQDLLWPDIEIDRCPCCIDDGVSRSVN